jgi:hypothetical protein
VLSAHSNAWSVKAQHKIVPNVPPSAGTPQPVNALLHITRMQTNVHVLQFKYSSLLSPLFKLP